MRVFLLGLDGLSPKIVERFARDGTCPNFRRIMDTGGFSKALSAIPAQTPENWTTIATGAWPGTHGVTVWGTHNYGEPVTERHGTEAMSSTLCKAEYLWEAGERQGLRSILHYFIGYPPTTQNTIHVDWIGWHPGKYYFEFSPGICYVQGPRGQRDVEGCLPVEFKKAEGWANVESLSTPLEAEIQIPSKQGQPLRYYSLLTDPAGNGYEVCLLSRERDASKAFCELRENQWSGWIREEFLIGDERKSVPMRFKLMELSRDGRVFRLYKSQGYPTSGFTSPPEIGEDLVDKFGPYLNEGVAGLFFKGLVDRDVFSEEYAYQTRWIHRSATYLMDRYHAQLYILHWHLPDYLGHQVLGLADPSGGMYDEAGATRAWEILRLGYSIADEMIGNFLRCVDEETYLFVISDHGSATNRKRYSIVEELARRGLVEVREADGSREIDWQRSKVFIDLTNLYVNVKGRYEGGVVEESEYESVRDEAIDILRSCKDQDGEYVLSFALRREDASVVGLWGENVGDVVFAYSPGFTWGHSLNGGQGSTRVGGATHGPKIPTAETDISSNYATFMVVGGDAKRGYRRPVERVGPVQLVDVAPTVSHLLGIDPPRHSQGRILRDFFEGWEISDVKRSRRNIDLPTRERLEGDVTDSLARPSK